MGMKSSHGTTIRLLLQATPSQNHPKRLLALDVPEPRRPRASLPLDIMPSLPSRPNLGA